MSNTTSKDAPLYGLAYQKLQTALFRLRKYGEMRLSSYLSMRMGVEGWTFSSADIAQQTGLNRHKTYELCDLLVKAGIFKMKEENKGETTIYNFDKTALQNYLQGEIALSALAMAKCSVEQSLPGCSDATQPGISTTTTWHLADHPPGTSSATSGSITCHLPGSSPATIINIENEEEKEDEKYIHTNRAYVCISQTPAEEQTQCEAKEQTQCLEKPDSAEMKADVFIKRAKSLQASNPEFGIIIKSKVQNRLVDLFASEPSLSVEELGNEWFNALNCASDCKTLVRLDDPLNYNGTKLERGEYDEHFWVKRSRDLTFFLNNRENVLAHTNELQTIA